MNWRDRVLERDVRLDAAGLFLMIGADPSTTGLHKVGAGPGTKGFAVTRDSLVTPVPGAGQAGGPGGRRGVRGDLRRPLLPRRLSSFARPDHLPGSPAAPASELGLRNVAFEVHDLQAAVDQAATDGYRPVGGIGEYEGSWRMAYVRGPEGIIVSLAEHIR